jgi:hypothetical protein
VGWQRRWLRTCRRRLARALVEQPERAVGWSEQVWEIILHDQTRSRDELVHAFITVIGRRGFCERLIQELKEGPGTQRDSVLNAFYFMTGWTRPELNHLWRAWIAEGGLGGARAGRPICNAICQLARSTTTSLIYRPASPVRAPLVSANERTKPSRVRTDPAPITRLARWTPVITHAR